MTGYYRLPRRWMDMRALGGDREPFCKRAAWIWLIEEARWQDGVTNIAGKLVSLKRGQLSHALRFIAEAWNWPLTNVKRFLERLCKDDFISLETGTGTTVITIRNYSEYSFGDETGGTGVVQEWYTGGTDLKERKKEERKKEDSTLPRPPFRVVDGGGEVVVLPTVPTPRRVKPLEIDAGFDEFYRAYPRRKARPEALKAWREQIRKGAHSSDIISGLNRHLTRNQFQMDKPKYIPYPATWLRAESWNDEVDPPKAAQTDIWAELLTPQHNATLEPTRNVNGDYEYQNDVTGTHEAGSDDGLPELSHRWGCGD